MDNDRELQESRDAVKAFNSLDEKLRDKLLNGVKFLAFLQDLADISDDDDEPATAQNAVLKDTL